MKKTTVPPAPLTDLPRPAGPHYRHYSLPPKALTIRLADLADALPEGARRPAFSPHRTVTLPCDEIFSGLVPRIPLARLVELAPDSLTAEGLAGTIITLPAARLARSFQFLHERELLPEPPPLEEPISPASTPPTDEITEAKKPETPTPSAPTATKPVKSGPDSTEFAPPAPAPTPAKQAESAKPAEPAKPEATKVTPPLPPAPVPVPPVAIEKKPPFPTPPPPTPSKPLSTPPPAGKSITEKPAEKPADKPAAPATPPASPPPVPAPGIPTLGTIEPPPIASRAPKPPFVPKSSVNIPAEEPAPDVPEPATPPPTSTTPPHKTRGIFSVLPIFRRKETAKPKAPAETSPAPEKTAPPVAEKLTSTPAASDTPPRPADLAPPPPPAPVSTPAPAPPHPAPAAKTPPPPAPAPFKPKIIPSSAPKPFIASTTQPPASAIPVAKKDFALADKPAEPTTKPVEPASKLSPKPEEKPARLIETEHFPKNKPASPPPDDSPAQEGLQSLFLTEEYLTVERVLQLCSDLPGIKSCVLSREATVVAAHNVPDSIDLISLSAHAMDMLRAMRTSSAKMGLGAIPAVTIHSEKGPVSFFNREDLCLCVLHKDRGFVPGVREKLHQVLVEISRSPLELPVGPGKPPLKPGDKR